VAFETLLLTASFGATLQDKQDPFIVCDLGSVIRQYKNWISKLPRVEPFYGKSFCIFNVVSFMKNTMKSY